MVLCEALWRWRFSTRDEAEHALAEATGSPVEEFTAMSDDELLEALFRKLIAIGDAPARQAATAVVALERTTPMRPVSRERRTEIQRRRERMRQHYEAMQPIALTAASANCDSRLRVASRMLTRPRERRPGTNRRTRRASTSARRSKARSKGEPPDAAAFSSWPDWLNLAAKRGRCPVCGCKLVRGVCPNASCPGWSL